MVRRSGVTASFGCRNIPVERKEAESGKIRDLEIAGQALGEKLEQR